MSKITCFAAAVAIGLVSGCQPTAWPMWGATPDLSFHVEGIDISRPPSPGWTCDMFKDGQVYAIVSDGRSLFVGGFVKDADFRLVALRLADGSLIWQSERMSGSRASLLSAIVGNGRLLLIADDALVDLDAGSGAEVWRQPGEWRAITLANEHVIAMQENGVAAFVQADGREIWRRQASLGQVILAAARDDLVAIANGAGMTLTLRAINARDGTVLWDKPQLAEQAIGKGAMLFGVQFGRPSIIAQALNAETGTGAVILVDPVSGSITAKCATPGPTGIGLAGDGRNIYVPSLSMDGGVSGISDMRVTVTRFELAGPRQIWSRGLGLLNSLPILAGRTLLVRTQCDLLAMEARTGRGIWRQRIGPTTAGAFEDHLILAGGRIVYTEDGTIHALVANGLGQSLPVDEASLAAATQPADE